MSEYIEYTKFAKLKCPYCNSHFTISIVSVLTGNFQDGPECDKCDCGADFTIPDKIRMLEGCSLLFDTIDSYATLVAAMVRLTQQWSEDSKTQQDLMDGEEMLSRITWSYATLRCKFTVSNEEIAHVLQNLDRLLIKDDALDKARRTYVEVAAKVIADLSGKISSFGELIVCTSVSYSKCAGKLVETLGVAGVMAMVTCFAQTFEEIHHFLTSRGVFQCTSRN